MAQKIQSKDSVEKVTLTNNSSNGFPYEHFEGFVNSLKEGKAFLLDAKIDINDDNLSKLKNEFCGKKVEEREKFIKESDLDIRIILLHAYWLWYYPFGFKSFDLKNNQQKNFLEKLAFNLTLKEEFFENKIELAGMGTYSSLQHDEVDWILENVFRPISKSTDFESFKDSFINTHTSSAKISTRNLLLHILAKDKYEPIAKQEEKERIVNTFFGLLGNKSVDNVDVALREIRRKLEMNNCSFYDSKYSKYWRNDLSTAAKKLEYKKALVLYGPPGTGKTYTAMEIAKTLIVKHYLSTGSGDVLEKCKEYINKSNDEDFLNNDEHINYLQFHINYNYEDFIAGQTIETDVNGKSSVRTKKGFIFDVIDEARKNPKAPYIVILDEINRTDISRVFGELFTAIEKRNKDVILSLPDPTSTLNKRRLVLNIPDNIYFIGTMNEIDFSLERIDFALRRRFVWEYCGYDANALKEIIKRRISSIADEKLNCFVNSCNILNGIIEEILGESYHIGHAFFAEIANIYNQVNDSEVDKWKYSKEILWEISIKPTLEAYCGTMESGLKQDYLGKKNATGKFYNAFFEKKMSGGDE